MIRFPLKAKRRQQGVLGRHLIGLQETLYKLTDELVIFQSQSIEEKIKLSSGVRCPVSVRPCVRNSYLSTSATNQDEYEDEINDDNNENDKDDNNKNVDNSYDEIDNDNNENDEEDNNKNVDDSYVNCRPVSVRV